MRTSAAGIRALVREEGCVLHPYNDSAGHATIGVGHLLHFGPVTFSDRARLRKFSQAEAVALLREDLRKFEAAVNRAVKVRVSQGEFDAMISLAFNIGTGGFSSSSVVKALNAGHRRAAANAFLLWRNPPELLPRRRRERALFLAGGVPDPVARYLTPHERKLCVAYDGIRRNGGKVPGSLHEDLVRARKRVWRAAQGSGGWAKAHRRERYRALARRS